MQLDTAPHGGRIWTTVRVVQAEGRRPHRFAEPNLLQGNRLIRHRNGNLARKGWALMDRCAHSPT